jgi:glutamyl-tRNA synthetase
MIELFSVDNLSRNAAVFDPAKLEWMNGQHLSLMAASELAPRVTAALVAAELTTSEHLAQRTDWYHALVDLLKVRARTIDDIVRQAFPYFRETVEYDPSAVASAWKDRTAAHALLTATREALADAPAWDAATLEGRLRSLADAKGVGAGKIFQPLRVALTGSAASPGIFDVLVLLGRDKSLRRIDAALRSLEDG